MKQIITFLLLITLTHCLSQLIAQSEWEIVSQDRIPTKSIQFVNENIGWGLNNDWDGNLFSTQDGGNSWDLVTNHSEHEYQYIEKFSFLDDSLGYLKCVWGIYKTLERRT